MCLYPVVILKEKKNMGLLEILEAGLQIFFFYIDNFERSNPDIIDSSCGLHVRKIKYAFALLSRRKWSLDDLRQETIHLYDVKKKLFLLSCRLMDLQNFSTVGI